MQFVGNFIFRTGVSLQITNWKVLFNRPIIELWKDKNVLQIVRNNKFNVYN